MSRERRVRSGSWSRFGSLVPLEPEKWSTHLVVALSGVLAASCVGGDDSTERPRAVGLGLSTPALDQFALYAARSISLGPHVYVSGGDIGVRSKAAFTGAQASVAQQDQTDPSRTLFSPSVSLGAQASTGNIATDSLTNGGATTGVVSTFPAAAMPRLPLVTKCTPGTSDVTVASHSDAFLSPGSYGAVRISDHGRLTLAPGSYCFSSVAIAHQAELLSGGTTRSAVNAIVEGTLITEDSATISTVAGEPADAFRIGVAARDSGSTRSASIGAHSTVTALLAAPHGTLAFADHIQATGAFAGWDVTTSDHVSLVFQGGFPATWADQHGSQQLQGYIKAPASTAPVVGPLAADESLTLAIGLPLKNRTGLFAFARDVSNPSSGNYRKYLTLDQFTNIYAPDAANYDAVASWAETNLLATEKSAGRIVLSVVGRAEDVESAFHIVGLIRFGGQVSYAADLVLSYSAGLM